MRLVNYTFKEALYRTQTGQSIIIAHPYHTSHNWRLTNIPQKIHTIVSSKTLLAAFCRSLSANRIFLCFCCSQKITCKWMLFGLKFMTFLYLEYTCITMKLDTCLVDFLVLVTKHPHIIKFSMMLPSYCKIKSIIMAVPVFAE